MKLQASTERLFPHCSPEAPARAHNRAFLIERLLEEGERDDLVWLCERVPRSALADWLASRGGRRLSRRSRSFWQLLLGSESGPPVEGAEELWPL